jgi:hypothetical protein
MMLTPKERKDRAIVNDAVRTQSTRYAQPGALMDLARRWRTRMRRS